MAVNLKPMQMHVRPAEGDLNHSVQLAERLLAVHRQVLLVLLTDLVQRWAQMEQPAISGPFAHLLDRAPPNTESCPLTE